MMGLAFCKLSPAMQVMNANSAPDGDYAPGRQRAATRNRLTDLESIELPMLPLLPATVEPGVSDRPRLAERIRSILGERDLDSLLAKKPRLERELISETETLALRAYPQRKKTVVYYGAHAIIDIGHAEGWLDHVVEPQVKSEPDSRKGIAEGLIIRADASLDYFDYCLAHARELAA